MKQTNGVSAILLAGGIGARMNSEIPKQFLKLGSKPIALHSFDLFCSMPEIHEIVVVCDPEYYHLFASHDSPKKVAFAMPGSRRQDSVENGFKATSPHAHLLCIHDAARPLIDRAIVAKAIAAADVHGAATLGVPVKITVKQSNSDQFVDHTPHRSLIWEIQTPQVIRRDLLQEGMRFANEHGITVTDDVSLVELIDKKVKLVEGYHHNMKITIPQDLHIAHLLMTHTIT